MPKTAAEKEVGTPSKRTQVRLVEIKRGFGGDNARYEIMGPESGDIIVSVSWAMLVTYSTAVFVSGKKVAEFGDEEYVQPHEALERMGYEVHGTVDFAYVTERGER